MSDDKTTSRDLNPAEVFSWPLIVAMLERVGDWGPYAFRLGVLQLIRGELARMVNDDANAVCVARMREYVEVLARLPWRES